MYLYVQTNVKGSSGKNPAYVEAFQDTARLPTQKEQLKMSKRLAIIQERQTKWETESPGIPFEIVGDSAVVTGWLNGTYRCRAKCDQRRVDAFVDRCEYLSSKYNVRPPSFGSDLVRHEYREANGRADHLTHDARNGNIYTSMCTTLSPYHRAVKYPAAYRAMFDGGVSADGVGCGFWIQCGLLPLNIEASPFGDMIQWIDVCESSFAIDPTSSVTDAELTAVENCLEAAMFIIATHQRLYFI